MTDNVKWLGISVDRWVQMFQSVGTSTIILGFVCVLAWKYIPPVVEGHVELLRRTGDTLQSMDETLKQSNKILSEVNEVEKATSMFMISVNGAHAEAKEKLQALVSGQAATNQKLDVIVDQTKH